MKDIRSYIHKGKREYQEDKFYCSPQGDLIIIADGVGGLAKGEEASRIIVENIPKEWEKRDKSVPFEEWIPQLIEQIIIDMNRFAQDNPSAYKMGSTLSAIFQEDDRYFAVHIGDSPIYHFSQDGDIKWKSKDHSFVQELMDLGHITAEEAANHPRRNVITRVLQAVEGHKVKADIHMLEDVQEGDVFLVCSDGVTESWSDNGLSGLIGSTNDIDEILEAIQNYAEENSSDNNTAIIGTVQLTKQEVIPPLVTEMKANDDRDDNHTIDSETMEIIDSNDELLDENPKEQSSIEKEEDTPEKSNIPAPPEQASLDSEKKNPVQSQEILKDKAPSKKRGLWPFFFGLLTIALLFMGGNWAMTKSKVEGANQQETESTTVNTKGRKKSTDTSREKKDKIKSPKKLDKDGKRIDKTEPIITPEKKSKPPVSKEVFSNENQHINVDSIVSNKDYDNADVMIIEDTEAGQTQNDSTSENKKQ